LKSGGWAASLRAEDAVVWTTGARQEALRIKGSGIHRGGRELVREAQAQAHAGDRAAHMFFGAREGHEDLLDEFRGHARAGVPHRDLHAALVLGAELLDAKLVFAPLAFAGIGESTGDRVVDHRLQFLPGSSPTRCPSRVCSCGNADRKPRPIRCGPAPRPTLFWRQSASFRLRNLLYTHSSKA
jgi:hypothetical protein